MKNKIDLKNKKFIIIFVIIAFILILISFSITFLNSNKAGKGNKIKYGDFVVEYLSSTEELVENVYGEKLDKNNMNLYYDYHGNYQTFGYPKHNPGPIKKVIDDANKLTEELLEKTKNSLTKDDPLCSNVKSLVKYRYSSSNYLSYCEVDDYQSIIFFRQYSDACAKTVSNKVDSVHIYSKKKKAMISQEEFLSEIGLTKEEIYSEFNIDSQYEIYVYYDIDSVLCVAYEKGNQLIMEDIQEYYYNKQLEKDREQAKADLERVNAEKEEYKNND